MLAAFGMPSAVFHGGDGTGAREGLLRVWHHEHRHAPGQAFVSYELTQRLETEIKITFDPYARKIRFRRAQVASKLASVSRA